MIKFLILVSSLTAGFAHADAWFVARAGQLTAEWGPAESESQLRKLKQQSYDLLKSRVKKLDGAEDVNALAQLLGAVYARSFDPLHDLLALYRGRLKDDGFRALFEQAVAGLPDAQRSKLERALEALKRRPDCGWKGKEYVCVEAAQ